jgi:urease accessory protein
LTILRATRVQPADDDAFDTITLDHAARHRRRVAMTSDGGFEFLLDLASAHALRHGDGLVLEDGRVIRVQALPEPLTEIRGKDAVHLVQLAWQIGNRHLEAQIEADRIVIRRDHVISAMLVGLDATIKNIEEIFQPVAGAYGHHH